MTSTGYVQSSFNAGELSPLVRGRADIPAIYNAGMMRSLNVLALTQGASPRRPPTEFKTAITPECRKIGAFRYTVGDAYVIEFGHFTMRFYRPDGTKAGGDLVTPWTPAQSRVLRLQQSADVIWMAHPDHPLRELRRTAPDTFLLQEAELLDGPYLSENVTGTTLNVGGTGTGILPVDASADLFTSQDLGRLLRLKVGDSAELDDWCWGVIRIVGGPRNIAVEFKTAVASQAPTAAWRLGLYGGRTGFPSAVCLHQERLILGSNCAGTFPRIDGSMSGRFWTFTPGTADDNALQNVVAGDEVPLIRDVRSANRALIVGTVGGVYRVATSSTSSAITPTNADFALIEPVGCGTVPAIRARKAVLFADAQQSSIGEVTYNVGQDDQDYRELTERCEHLLRDQPIVDMAWAAKPWGQIVAVRADGRFLLGTYNPKAEVIGFTLHELGGSGALPSELRKVVSCAVLPTETGDAIFLLVDQYGGMVLERLQPLLKNAQPDWEGGHLDSLFGKVDAVDATLTRTSVAPETGIETWTASIACFDGTKDPNRYIKTAVNTGLDRRTGLIAWSIRSMKILTVVSATVITAKPDAPALALPAKVEAWKWNRTITEVTGIPPHLESWNVHAFADGAEVGPLLVVDNKVTLPFPAGWVVIGLPYTSTWQGMPPNPPTEKGSPVGRVTKIVSTRLRVLRAAGLKQLNHDGSKSGLLPLRQGAQPAGSPPPLHTGSVKLAGSEASEDDPVAPVIVADGPHPATLLAVAYTVQVGEAG